MRNPNPFTKRQLQLLEALRNRLVQITDPDQDIITHESFTWATKATKQFGAIPTIIFRPTGSANRIKAEIVREARLLDQKREEELTNVQLQFGIRTRKHKEARLFNAEIDNLMFAIKKHTYAAAVMNKLFATEAQKLSDPIKLMQSIIMTEHRLVMDQQTAPIHAAPAETQGSKAQRTYATEL